MIYQALSILIPVYNTPRRWLHECIESIERQTFNNYEVVIVNDGSTNIGTLDFLERLAKKSNFNVIQRRNNRGIAYSLNEGLKNCTCELVARMDSNDVMARDRLNRQIQYVNTHPDISLFGTRMIYFKESKDGKKFFCGFSPVHPRVVSKNIALQNNFWFINHATVFYKKSEILGIGGYDISTRGYAEDYELWIRMLQRGLIIHNTPEPLFYCRKHDGLSNNFYPDIDTFLLRTRDKLRNEDDRTTSAEKLDSLFPFEGLLTT